MTVPRDINQDVGIGATPQDQTREAFPSTNLTHASAATDAAAASVGNIGTMVWRAPCDIAIVSAFHEPTGADQPAAAAASYRTFSLIDGGTDGTGTRVLASANLTASQGSNTTRSIALGTNTTVPRGNVVFGAYSATAGGTHAGTVVRAGHFTHVWRPL